MKSTGLLLFSLFIFVNSASAAVFSDNFNDQDISDWTIVSGSWTFSNAYNFNNQSGYYLNNSYATAVAQSYNLSHSSVSVNYFEIKINNTRTTAGGFAYSVDTVFWFQANDTHARGINVNTLFFGGAQHKTIQARGWAGYTDFALPDNHGWVKIIGLINNSQITIRVYNESGALLNQQVVAYTSISSQNKIILQASNDNPGVSQNIEHNFDDVVISSSSSGFDVNTAIKFTDIADPEDAAITSGSTGINYFVYATVADADFDIFNYNYFIKILKDGNEIGSFTMPIAQFGDDLGTLTAGTYTAEIRREASSCFPSCTVYTVLASAQMVVNQTGGGNSIWYSFNSTDAYPTILGIFDPAQHRTIYQHTQISNFDSQAVYWYEIISPNGLTYKIQGVNSTSQVDAVTLFTNNMGTYRTYLYKRLNSVTTQLAQGDFSIQGSQPSEPDLQTSYLLFDKENYAKNEISTITYHIGTPTFSPMLYDFSIKLYDSQDNLVFVINNDVIVQTGTYQYQFQNTGTYRVRLIRSFIGITQTILAEDVATVDMGQSYIFANSTIPVGENFTVRFQYGFNPAHTLQNGIRISKYTSNAFVFYKFYSTDPDLNDAANTQYSINASVNEEGLYKFELRDFYEGTVATTTSNAVFSFIPPQLNLTASYIDTDSNFYFLGDYIYVSYGVDNTNFSSYQKYLAFYDNNRSIFTIPDFAVTRQQDTVQFQAERFTCGHSPYLPVVCSINYNVEWFAGLYTVRLYAFNSTYTTILASKNITISGINLAGYGITIPKSTFCIGEGIKVNITIPAGRTGKYQLVKQRPDGYTTIISEKIVNSSFSFIYNSQASNTNIAGNYIIYLFSEGSNYGTIEMTRTFNIDNCAAGNVTLTPNPISDVPNKTAEMLNSGLIATIIIMMLFAAIGYYTGGHWGSVVMGSAGFIVCAVFGLIPTWALYLFALIIIIVAAKTAADVTTGDTQ